MLPMMWFWVWLDIKISNFLHPRQKNLFVWTLYHKNVFDDDYDFDQERKYQLSEVENEHLVISLVSQVVYKSILVDDGQTSTNMQSREGPQFESPYHPSLWTVKKSCKSHDVLGLHAKFAPVFMAEKPGDNLYSFIACLKACAIIEEQIFHLVYEDLEINQVFGFFKSHSWYDCFVNPIGWILSSNHNGDWQTNRARFNFEQKCYQKLRKFEGSSHLKKRNALKPSVNQIEDAVSLHERKRLLENVLKKSPFLEDFPERNFKGVVLPKRWLLADHPLGYKVDIKLEKDQELKMSLEFFGDVLYMFQQIGLEKGKITAKETIWDVAKDLNFMLENCTASNEESKNATLDKDMSIRVTIMLNYETIRPSFYKDGQPPVYSQQKISFDKIVYEQEIDLIFNTPVKFDQDYTNLVTLRPQEWPTFISLLNPKHSSQSEYVYLITQPKTGSINVENIKWYGPSEHDMEANAELHDVFKRSNYCKVKAVSSNNITSLEGGLLYLEYDLIPVVNIPVGAVTLVNQVAAEQIQHNIQNGKYVDPYIMFKPDTPEDVKIREMFGERKEWVMLTSGRWEDYEEYYNEALQHDPTIRMFTKSEYETFLELYTQRQQVQEVIDRVGYKPIDSCTSIQTTNFTNSEEHRQSLLKSLNFLQRWVLNEFDQTNRNSHIIQENLLHCYTEMSPKIYGIKNSEDVENVDSTEQVDVLVTRDSLETLKGHGRVPEFCKIESNILKVMEYPLGNNSGVLVIEFFTFESFEQIQSFFNPQSEEAKKVNISKEKLDQFAKMIWNLREIRQFENKEEDQNQRFSSASKVLDMFQGAVFPVFVLLSAKLTLDADQLKVTKSV